jgi:hypothetical protein
MFNPGKFCIFNFFFREKCLTLENFAFWKFFINKKWTYKAEIEMRSLIEKCELFFVFIERRVSSALIEFIFFLLEGVDCEIKWDVWWLEECVIVCAIPNFWWFLVYALGNGFFCFVFENFSGLKFRAFISCARKKIFRNVNFPTQNFMNMDFSIQNFTNIKFFDSNFYKY